MKHTAKILAAMGSITVILYSIGLTFLGALLSYDAEPAEPLFISPLLVCGIAGFLAAGLGLASCFISAGNKSRLFAAVSAALSIAVAAVMILSFEFFDLILTMIFAIPALVLTAASIVSLMPDKNGQSGTTIKMNR